MKKFKIDLTEYNVTVSVNKRNEETNQIDLVTEEIPYPIKINLYQWLRMPGMFKGGVEICDACDLAKTIRDADDDITLDETELKLLTTAMDTLIAQKNDPARGVQALGGEVHEECIRRVFKAEEVR
ncbi:hypothetical protein LCGC14_2762400 [marine sediment metagenome]|uniref:Uncharacterized protein n=1 Tax=marine sediment metagenome TaxID=412755 RepID=A0A0F8YYP0_9ZZZZ